MRRWLDDPRLAAVRRWLDEHLFRDAPPAPELTGRRAAVIAALAVIGVAMQLARVWASNPLETLWTEDGSVWLQDAMTRGFGDALTTPYNGYLQTLGRLVAEPVAALPVEWFPATMALIGAAIVIGMAFLVWRASAAHIEDPYLRGALAALMVLLPTFGVEDLANVTNSIWFLLFASFWVLLWRPRSFGGALLGAGVLFLAAVTNAGMVVLAPLWAARLIAFRDRRDAAIVIAFAVGLAIQLGISAGDTNLLSEEGRKQVVAEPNWEWEVVAAYAQRVIGGAFGGYEVSAYLWRELGGPFLVALALGLVGLVAVAVARGGRAAVLVAVAVAASVAIFLTAGYRRWDFGGSALYWPSGLSGRNATHHVIVPTLLLLSAVAVLLDSVARAGGAETRLRMRAVMAGLVVVGLLSFDASDAIRSVPTWSEEVTAARSACQRGGETARLRIAPVRLFDKWVVETPCSKLE